MPTPRSLFHAFSLLATLAPARLAAVEVVVNVDAPAAPRLLAPFADVTRAGATPTFRFAVLDPQADDVNFELEVADSGDFSALWYTGYVQAVGNGSSAQLTLPADSALTSGVTYGWRVRALDPLGTNTYGLWSETRFYRHDTMFARSAFTEQTGAQFAWGAHDRTRANFNLDVVELGPDLAAGFVESFDSLDSITSWSINNFGSAASASYDPVGGVEGGGILLTDPAGASNTVVATSPGRTTFGRVHAAVWAKPSGDGALFLVGGDSVTTVPAAIATVGFSGGHIVTHASHEATDVVVLVPYVIGEWVRLGLDIDADGGGAGSGTYDVWVNNDRVAVGRATLNTGSARAVGVVSDGFGTLSATGTHRFDGFVLAPFATEGNFCTRSVQVTDPDVGANGWHSLSWEATDGTGQVVSAYVEACSEGGSCSPLSDGVLPGNGSHFFVSPVSLSTIDGYAYTTLRVCFSLGSDSNLSSPQLSLARMDFLPQAGVCAGVPYGTACDDGDFCTDGTSCIDGVCKNGTPHVCVDGDSNACTDVTCSSDVGACVPVYNTATCDDGLACTSGDHCADGVCVGTTLVCEPPHHVTLVVDSVATAGSATTVRVQAVDANGSAWVGAVSVCVSSAGSGGGLDLTWSRPTTTAGASASIGAGVTACGTTNLGGYAELILTTPFAQSVALSVTSDLQSPGGVDDFASLLFLPGAAAGLHVEAEAADVRACREAAVRLEVVDAFGNRLSGATMSAPIAVSLMLASADPTATFAETTLVDATTLPAQTLDGVIGSSGVASVALGAEGPGSMTLSWNVPVLDGDSGTIAIEVVPAALDLDRSWMDTERWTVVAGDSVDVELQLVDSCEAPFADTVAVSLFASDGTLTSPVATADPGRYVATLTTERGACPRTIVVSAEVGVQSMGPSLYLQVDCPAPMQHALPRGCATGSPSGGGFLLGLLVLARLLRRR